MVPASPPASHDSEPPRKHATHHWFHLQNEQKGMNVQVKLRSIWSHREGWWIETHRVHLPSAHRPTTLSPRSGPSAVPSECLVAAPT